MLLRRSLSDGEHGCRLSQEVLPVKPPTGGLNDGSVLELVAFVDGVATLLAILNGAQSVGFIVAGNHDVVKLPDGAVDVLAGNRIVDIVLPWNRLRVFHLPVLIEIDGVN